MSLRTEWTALANFVLGLASHHEQGEAGEVIHVFTVVPTRQEAGCGSHSRPESYGKQLGGVSFTPQLRYPREKSSRYILGKRLGGHPSQYARCREEKISRHQLHKDGPGWRSLYSDSLRTGWSGDRIPVVKFSAPVQTGPGVQPSSYTIATGSFSGVQQPGRGVDHPPSPSAEVKERAELYLYSPFGHSWPVLGRTLPFTN